MQRHGRDVPKSTALLEWLLLDRGARPQDIDPITGQTLLAGRTADILDDLSRWRFPRSGFLSHLRSF
jgi:hypothetical protein